ncbi:MAG: ATP-dependent protease LonB [Candidatus Hydrothermarchaeaceae archaeon]
MNFKTTKGVKVPKSLIEQVIGQESAVEVLNKASEQKRHILLIGEPGTGKSMLGLAMSELLKVEELEDILIYPNKEEKNNPKVEIVKTGEGEKTLKKYRDQKRKAEAPVNMMFKVLFIFIMLLVIYYGFLAPSSNPMVLFGGIIASVFLLMGRQYIKVKDDVLVPKLLVNNAKNKKAPFIDATGSHAGALLGDVRHDPFQSGGLETPPHELVEAGAIHRASKGILFIDEIATLGIESQQDLLTGLQEKKYQITGQSERSSGAMIRTEPVTCDFILVAAGNLETVSKMHPALRSRIRGYGYEVYMKEVMDNNLKNRNTLVQFVAQEVIKDKKIPHFKRAAVIKIIEEAKRRSGRREKLTLRLRGLGGLIRAAGDVARGEKSKYVELKHVIKAKSISKTLEQQIADRYISVKKDYNVYTTKGGQVGRVNGLAVIGQDSGVILPIVAEVAPAQSKREGKIIATGKLQTIALEAIQNVSAVIKKHTGVDISKYDVHIQFLQTYEGVEGDSASISVATAVISALEGISVDQSTAMTGSLTVRGDVLPIGGVNAKIEAAITAGIKTVIIPESNKKDVMVEKKGSIKVISVKNLSEALEHAFVWSDGKESLLKKIKDIIPLPDGIKKPSTDKHVA